jgi:cytochrome c553
VYRNKKLLEVARLLPCQHCGIEDGTVVAAHSNQLRDGKGRGLKSSDFRIASLCFRCHAEADTSSTLTKVARIEMWEQAHRATIGELFERGLVVVNSKL